jgi:hypothetical protein
MMPPPGGRNWQLINPNFSSPSKFYNMGEETAKLIKLFSA